MGHPLLTHVQPSAENQRTLQGGHSLQVGAANDPLEHEADRVADAVMSGSPVSSWSFGKMAVSAQRKCATCEEEDKR